jgi:hypothetical protein
METHNSLIHLQWVCYIQWQSRRGRNSSGGGRDIAVLGNRRNHDCYSLNVNILGKTAMLPFTLALFCDWSCANSACRLFDIAVLMSNSHSLLSTSLPFLLLKCSQWNLSPNPRSCLCTVQHLTKRTRQQINNNTLVPANYHKVCVSKLNGLKHLNSSRIVFAILAGETTLS